MESEGVLVVPGVKQLNNSKPLKGLLSAPPEFLDPNGPLTLGGFGALALPSSFHHPDIRFIRSIVYRRIKPILANHFKHTNLELLFDRVSVRRVGTSTSKESWHRDVCPDSLEDDVILGGWINLDPDGSPPQQFSCSPGTHKDKTDKTGFAKIEIAPDNTKVYNVPPGHIIMFYQNLIHEVKPQKAKFESHRLYLGWRLTNSNKPLFNHRDVIRSQGVPKIPSGQVPPMYAKLHLVNHKHMVEEISRRIKPEYLNPKTNLIYRELPSMGPYYQPYSEEDISIMTPQPLH